MNIDKDQRTSLRVDIEKLTSIVKNGGVYEVVPGDDKTTITEVKIIDISTGGGYAQNRNTSLTVITFDLEIPEIKSLDATILRCESTRSIFRGDPLQHVHLGTDKDKSYSEIGLKFEKAHSKYLKQLYEPALAKEI